jgi:uncharacterized protein involved in type VI secretion and phage assembly
LRAGSYIQVAGVGTRFGGVYRLRKVTHTIDDNGYVTEFDITQQAESSLLSLIRKKTDIDLTPARDHTEKFYGVYVAKVILPPSILTDGDPASTMGARVKVTFPWLSDTNLSAWARVCVPQASIKGSGVYFMPNPGDTVIVAFQDGEISMPVVIGSVWDGPYQPTVYPPLPTNLKSEIATRAGQAIILDDTPGAGGVTISNLLGSSIKLDMLGNVSITAANAINLTAKNVAVTVTGAMTVT